MGWLPPSSLKISPLLEPMGLSTFRGDDQIHGFDYPASLRSACTKASSLSRPPLRRPSVNHNACLPTRSKWLETVWFTPLGCPELPDPPICLRVGILHSRAVGIDVEMHLCSCFREAQHCGRFVCSLDGFLDAAAGVNTKPTPVRESGSPRLPGSFPRVRGKRGRGDAPVGGLGLIPACAGKTSATRARSSGRGAHPCVCGEN